eukprot:SAG31_NODE_1452_length_8286_cov_6.329547_6_plen_39_part_00
MFRDVSRCFEIFTFCGVEAVGSPSESSELSDPLRGIKR